MTRAFPPQIHSFWPPRWWSFSFREPVRAQRRVIPPHNIQLVPDDQRMWLTWGEPARDTPEMETERSAKADNPERWATAAGQRRNV